MMDMMQLQTDYLSIPARQLVGLLENLESDDEKVQKAISRLMTWDNSLEAHSIEAAIYHSWESKVRTKLWDMMVPDEIKSFITSIQHLSLIHISEPTRPY